MQQDDGRAVTGDLVVGLVAVEGQVGHGGQRIGAPEMARAITSRWISEVPSKMV